MATDHIHTAYGCSYGSNCPEAAQEAAPLSERAETLLMKMDRTGPDDVTLAEVKTFLARLSQGAAPRAEGHEHSFVLQQGATCRCGAAAPRAEGLDVNLLQEVFQHLGLAVVMPPAWKGGVWAWPEIRAEYARLSERRDKEGTE